MLKRLAILCVFLTVAQAPVPVPGQTTDNSTQASKKGTGQTDSNQTKQQPLTSAGTQSISTDTDKKIATEDASKNQDRPIVISKLPTVTVEHYWLDYAALAVSVGLLIIGYFGVKYAKKTLDAIADQAKSLHTHADHFDKLAAATQRQADIEEANMSQWVEAGFYGITTYELTKVPNSNAIQTAEIALRARVVNPTALPLTIKKIVVEICVEEPVWKTYEHTVSEFLAPSKTTDGYPFSVRLMLDAQQTASLILKQFICAAAMHIYFVEAIQTDRSQTFRSFLTCGMHNLASEPFRGDELHPAEQQQQPKKAN